MYEKVTESKKEEVIQCTYHPMKDWVNDKLGYFLIRVHKKKLEVGLCKKANVIVKKYIGKDAISVYNVVARDLRIRKDHAAYLGKELMKAEVAMQLGIEYIQDSPIDLRGFERKKTLPLKEDKKAWLKTKSVEY